MLWCPAVGLIIGLVLLLLALLLKSVGASVAAAILVVAWVIMTGALHLDDLADSADAWLGSHGDRGRALEIMKDPACGPAGVVAIFLIFVAETRCPDAAAGRVRFARLGYRLDTGEGGASAIVLVVRLSDYVRRDGMGAVMAAELRQTSVIQVFVTLAIVLVGVAGLNILW